MEKVVKSPFIEFIRREMHLRGYSIRTEKTYLTWIKPFIYFAGKRHPEEVSMGSYQWAQKSITFNLLKNNEEPSLQHH